MPTLHFRRLISCAARCQADPLPLPPPVRPHAHAHTRTPPHAPTRCRISITCNCNIACSCFLFFSQAAGNQTADEMQAKTEINLELNATAAELEANLPGGVPPGRPGSWGEDDSHAFLVAIGLVEAADLVKASRIDGMGLLVLRDYEAKRLGMDTQQFDHLNARSVLHLFRVLLWLVYCYPISIP